jgi:hypothetical protein
VVTQSEPESTTAADKARLPTAPRAVPTWHCRHGAHLVPTAAAPAAHRRRRHSRRGAPALADAVAGSVPRGAVHEPDQLLDGVDGPAAAADGPLLRLAAAAQPQPGAPPAVPGPAVRRRVEQRHHLLLRLRVLPRRAVPRRRAAALVALRRRCRVPGAARRRRDGLPPLGQGRLHLLLRGGGHGPARALGLRRW